MSWRRRRSDLETLHSRRSIRRLVYSLALLVGIAAVGTVGFHLLEGWSFLDAAFMTVISLTTVGYGETHPLSPAGRVLRAPAQGILEAHVEIGEQLEEGQVVASVAGLPIAAPFKGVLRGLLHPGLAVWPGLKVGDVDPRDDPLYCTTVSDKSLAIGGAVLEAILSRPELRKWLWEPENSRVRRAPE